MTASISTVSLHDKSSGAEVVGGDADCEASLQVSARAARTVVAGVPLVNREGRRLFFLPATAAKRLLSLPLPFPLARSRRIVATDGTLRFLGEAGMLLIVVVVVAVVVAPGVLL